MRAKLLFPLSVSLAAAFAAQVEGTIVALWASDHSAACSASSPTGACSLNSIVAFIAGTFVAAPRNSVHGFRNSEAEPIRLFNLHAPSTGFVDRLRGNG